MRNLMMVSALLTVALSGCGTGGVGTQREAQPPRSAQEKPMEIDPVVVSANLQFGLNLLAELKAQSEEPNLFFSPLSAQIALAMVLNGAENETYNEIASALGVAELSLEKTNTEHNRLLTLLRSPDPEVKVNIANSLWAQQGFPLERPFVERLTRFYDAYAENLDFAGHPEGALARVNGWIEEKTEGLIPTLFQQGDFTPLTRVVLVNTLYFKGKWQNPFDKEATSETPFHLEDGTTKPVPMMRTSGKYPYLRGEGFQAVALPYGKGELRFYLFLPDEGHTLAEFLKSLTAERWRQWMAQFEMAEGDVGLPRFRIESSLPLNEPLKALGIQHAFEPNRADFSRMNRQHGRELYISKAVQKAIIQVDEEGTEAAAATGVVVGITAMPAHRFSVIADRPFLFAIVHQPTGVVLFMGTVRAPNR